jgi:hypothetical protein
MENQETQNEQAPAGTAPELTITDLINIRSIIDAASRRGTFGASEMAGVGGVYNKLDTFLNAVAPQQPSNNDQAPAA